MNREILNRLTPKDVENIREQVYDCISVICEKAHPTAYHDCDEDCPFNNVCFRLDRAVHELDVVYNEHC